MRLLEIAGPRLTLSTPSGTDMIVWRNPSHTLMLSLLNKFPLRGQLMKDGDLYVWNANDGLHATVFDTLIANGVIDESEEFMTSVIFFGEKQSLDDFDYWSDGPDVEGVHGDGAGFHYVLNAPLPDNKKMFYRAIGNRELVEGEASKEIMNILDLPEPIRETALNAFHKLADDQRGLPEQMIDYQRNPGIDYSGLHHFLIEHVGDLTNRMAKKFHVVDQDCGFMYCKDKVFKTLRTLRNEYGFDREVNEQITNNYRYRKENRGLTMQFAEWREQWIEAGRRYAEAHAELTVWNDAQWYAREAAIYIGLHEHDEARRCLAVLDHHLSSPETWVAYAGQVTVRGTQIVYDRRSWAMSSARH